MKIQKVFNNPNGNSVVKCPVCKNTGIIKYDAPVLRGSVFVYELQVDDCPLCDAYGLVELKKESNDKDRRDNTERDIHSW